MIGDEITVLKPMDIYTTLEKKYCCSVLSQEITGSYIVVMQMQSLQQAGKHPIQACKSGLSMWH